ncbi:MAG: hypothetical protein DWQ47_00470 [Acidobacteria bacterium]|nr:MAG: hypothetical protein DWQ32_10930 [Acidobacteriota bacterium]REK03983.1 MAG: hypothetical protein DWQ38_00455 [Acidobacteriota bacterium]REK15145.1 MAG: hypothetical protein DWQ43_16620 [Acidobacteriota bacterium]REK46235.1 MAG: hypothetical protein DWQ47_00470 [Acidobacteriota bacterium]
MSIPLGKLSLSIVLTITITLVTFGQDLDEVSLRGTVHDVLGGVIPGAVIEISVGSQRGIRKAVSDANGRFSLIELPPGRLSISVSAEGFEAFRAESLSAVSGQVVHIQVTLEPSSIKEEVTVASDGPSLDISRTTIGSTLREDEIDALPNPSGDVLDLVFMLSGTDEESFSIDGLADDDRIGNGSEFDRPSEVIGAGSVSLSGGAAYSTNITIDGLDNNDDRSAEERFQPPPDSVAELQVVSNQFSAEYGRASGGRINIRTRAGDANLRWNVHASFQDESLNANTYNNNRRGLARLPFTKIDPAVTVSGPAPIQQQTKFLFSYALQTRWADSRIDTMVPVDTIPSFPMPAPTHPHQARVDDIPNPSSDSFPEVQIAPYIKRIRTPSVRHRITGRIDHGFSENHSVTAGLQVGRSRDLRQYRETTRYLEETLQARERMSDALQFTDSLVLSKALFNQFRFQYSSHRPAFAAKGADDPVVLLFISDDSRAGSPDQVRGTIVAGNSTANFANLRSENRFQVQDTLSAVAGSHTMRFGVDVQSINSTIRELRDTTGTFNFARVYDLIASQPSRYRRSFGSTSTQKNTYVGLFAQDDFQIFDGLTLSTGLRYERESILPDNNNVGPRIGVAWAPGGSGRFVIRAGAGVFYNRVLLRTLDDYSLGKSERRFDSEALSGPSSEARCLNQIEPGPNAHTDKCRFLNAIASRFPDPPDEGDIHEILSALGIAKGGFITDTNFTRFVSEGIRVPESYQFNAGFESEVGPSLFVAVSFNFNKASGLWRETNVNAFRAPTGYGSLTEYLLALGKIELNGQVTRFVLGDPADPDGVTEENGVRLVNLMSLNPSESRSSPIGIAFSALEATLERPFDPQLGQVEMVSSRGKSVYEGLSVSIRNANRRLLCGLSASFRAVYTFSRNRDDGFVDTSSAQVTGDFGSEFSASSIDRRHRFRLLGRMEFPSFLGGITFAPVIRIESPRPFNLGIGGSDRNLDDVSNDRPNFSGDLSRLVSRGPEDPFPSELVDHLTLPPIGSPGDLPRNAGRGPMLFVFNARFGRRLQLAETISVDPYISVTNILNAKVFSFGSDYVNLAESGSSEFQRGFLVPGRTLSQRKVQLGIKVRF